SNRSAPVSSIPLGVSTALLRHPTSRRNNSGNLPARRPHGLPNKTPPGRKYIPAPENRSNDNGSPRRPSRERPRQSNERRWRAIGWRRREPPAVNQSVA